MKKLPLEFPLIETYQGFSFVFGIMMANPAYSDIQYNGYIQLQSIKYEGMPYAVLLFANSLWDDFRDAGYIIKDVYDVANFNERTLTQFLCERLDQGQYLVLYDVDEYYLSYADAYQKKHENHDTYIYGYDDEYFYIQVYEEQNLAQTTIKKSEAVKALLSKRARKNADGVRHFGAIRLNPCNGVKADAKVILKGIREYFEPDNEDGENQEILFGIGVYKTLMNEIRNMKENGANIRAFRSLWEHKKLMVQRIAFLYSNTEDDRYQAICRICEKTKMIFRFMVKYSIIKEERIIDKSLKLFKEVWEEEIAWYEKFMKQEAHSVVSE